MSTVKSLSLDLKVYQSTDVNTLNIFSNRTGFIENGAYVDKKDFVLATNNSTIITELDVTKVVIIQSYFPVDITTTVGESDEPTLFKDQTLLVISNHVGEIEIINRGSKEAEVKVIRLAVIQILEPANLLSRQLITFSPLSRISLLPQSIVTLANVRVQSVTLADWVNDQITPVSSGLTVANKFRICDSDGSANPTGNYIMILNDIISQQNFSGTLQLWVEEISLV